MLHPQALKEEAIKLRKFNLTIDQIQKSLSKQVARSTIYEWTKAVPVEIPKSGSNYLKTYNENYWKSFYKKIDDEIPSISTTLLKNQEFREFICLYWAEGHKKNNDHRVQITNTDPKLIAKAQPVIKKFTKNKLIYTLFCQPEEFSSLSILWATELNISPSIIIQGNKKISSERRSNFGIMQLVTNDSVFIRLIKYCIDVLKNEESHIEELDSIAVHFLKLQQ